MKKKKQRLKRFLLLSLLVILLLPALAYFIVSTPFFIRNVVLSRVEQASGYAIQADTLSFSPFSRLELNQGTLRNGNESLTASFESLVTSYKLLDLLSDKLTVNEFTLIKPDITLTPPLPEGKTEEDSEEESTSTASSLPVLNLSDFRIEHGSFTLVTPEGTSSLRNFSFTLPALRTGQPAEPEMSGDVVLHSASSDDAQATRGSFTASAKFTLDRALSLSALSANLRGSLQAPEAPADEIRFSFSTEADPRLEEKLMKLTSLNAHAGVAQQDLLSLRLTNPTTISWGGDRPEITDTTLRLSIPDMQLADLNLQGLLPLSTARVRLNTLVTVRENGERISVEGDVDLRDLSGAIAGIDLTGWALDGSLSAETDADGIVLHRSNVRLDHRETNALDVSLEGRSDWKLLNASVNAKVAHADLGRLRQLPPDAPDVAGALSGSVDLSRTDGSRHTWDADLSTSGLSLPDHMKNVSGTLGLTGDGTMTDQAENFTLNSSGSLRNLSGEAHHVSLAPWAVSLNLKAAGDAQTVSMDSFDLRMMHNNQPSLDLSASGSAHRNLTQGNATVNLRTADLARLRTALPSSPDMSGILAGRVDLNQSAPDIFQWSGDLTARNLILPDRDELPSPLQLTTSGSGKEKTLTMKPTTISWPSTDGFSNRIEAKGSLNLKDPSAMIAVLSAQGDRVDLTKWLPPPSPVEPQTEPSATQAGGLPQTEPELPTLPFASSSFEMTFQHLKLEDIHVRDLSFKSRVDARRVEVSPLSFSLNGAPVSASARFAWENAPPDYTMVLKIDPVELQPLADRFMPDKKGAIHGVLRANADLKGSGLTGAHVRENLNGTFAMNFSDGQVRLLDQQPERDAGLVHTRELLVKLVTRLALALKLPPGDLLEPPVTDIRVNSRIKDGVLTLEEATVINPEIHLNARGRVDLDVDLPASRIERMPVVVGVNTNLAKRLKIYRTDRVRDERVFLPSFLQVDGTLGDPKIDVDKSVLTGLILSGVLERNEVGNERTNEILQGLGGLLSGEGPPPKPTPAPGPPPPAGATPTPTPKPSDTQRVLQGLQILRDRRATPTPVK